VAGTILEATASRPAQRLIWGFVPPASRQLRFTYGQEQAQLQVEPAKKPAYEGRAYFWVVLPDVPGTEVALTAQDEAGRDVATRTLSFRPAPD
jgi:hypothetical protein